MKKSIKNNKINDNLKNNYGFTISVSGQDSL